MPNQINNFFSIFLNPVLLPALFAWLLAQFLKVVIELMRYKRFRPLLIVASGGMPSSHTSFSIALSTSVGLHSGFNSVIFGVTFAYAIIVMTDATGVRQAAGKHAVVLNRMLEKLYDAKELDFGKLKELIGHKPMEVLAGAILGVVVGIVWWLIIVY